MVPLGAVYPNGAGAQGTSRPGQTVGSSQGSAGNLEQNLCGTRQRAANGHEGPPGTDVQGSGKLQEVLAFVVSATHEDRYGKWQSSPLSSFFFGPATDQELPLKADNYRLFMASNGPNSGVGAGNARFHAIENGADCGNRASCA